MTKVERIKEGSLKDQVRNAIFLYIKQLDNEQKNKLPSEDDLAKMLGVSRITIRGALDELNSQGFIFRRHGKGTFINTEALKLKVQFNPVRQFLDIISHSGYQPSIRIIELRQTTASAEVAKVLDIAEGDPVVVSRKVFYADQRPAYYCVDHFPLALLSSADDLADYQRYENSVFDFLTAKTGLAFAWDRIELSAVTSQDNTELARHFQCGDRIRAFLLCQGVNYDEQDRPLLYACEYIDTELIKYNMIRQKSFEFAD